MLVEIFPGLLEHRPGSISPGFVPVPHREEVLARKARMECKYDTIVGHVHEPRIEQLRFHGLHHFC